MVTAATSAISSFWWILSFVRIPTGNRLLPTSGIVRSAPPAPGLGGASQAALRLHPDVRNANVGALRAHKMSAGMALWDTRT
jgi:hypothetical protein